jgi:type II secretory pathway pseudopilin PulG
MAKKHSKFGQAGMALIEIIIGSAIISTGIIAAISSYSIYVTYAFANQKNVQAAYLLEEGLEVVTFFRDKGWSSNIVPLNTSTTYYLKWEGSNWATTTTPVYVDGEFLRSIRISNVNRNVSDQISEFGTYDPNTKLVTATVDYWQGHSTTTKSISTYISNIYDN